MKKMLLLALCVLTCWGGHAQDVDSGKTVLQLVKIGASGPVALTIKADKRIKVRTTEGEIFVFHNYSLLGDSAIASGDDVVLLKDVKMLRGKVKGNALRKTSGVALVGAGYYFGAAGFVYGMLRALSGANPLLLLLPVPALGVTLLGSELAGARRFDTTGKWQISVISQQD